MQNKERHVIGRNAFQKRICNTVYPVMQKALECDLEYPGRLVPPILNAKRMAAHRFAEFVTQWKFKTKKPPIICKHSLPSGGYVSWLLVRPLGIAYSGRGIKGHADIPDNAPATEVQIARAIVHEVGHIFATPELLSRQKNRIEKNGEIFTAPSTKEEEELAVVWSICAFGIALGHNAWKERKAGHIDNSTSLLI